MMSATDADLDGSLGALLTFDIAKINKMLLVIDFKNLMSHRI